jgi:hypothetical protein
MDIVYCPLPPPLRLYLFAVGKHMAGDLLDGREHKEFPA